MKRNKRSLRFLAESYRLDAEESLIVLWYNSATRFEYLKNPASIIKNKDYQFVRKLFAQRAINIKAGLNVEEKIRPVTVVVRDHDFSQIGRTADSHHYLTTDEIINIYEELVRDFAHNEDPINPAGVKDMKVLESAVFHPQTSYRGILKYPTIETAAAALMYAVTHNHPFFNGNKRTSMVAMLVFLDRHNISVTCSEDDLFRISIELAKHRLVSPERLYPDSEIDALAHWLHSNSKYIQKGERPISVRKFKQILAHFNCEILPDGRVQRSIPTKDILGFSSVKILTTRLARIEPGTEGRQMNRLLIKSIREELRMTHQYGIDSEQFYEMANPTVADFIHEYKKVLGRLAKI